MIASGIAAHLSRQDPRQAAAYLLALCKGWERWQRGSRPRQVFRVHTPPGLNQLRRIPKMSRRVGHLRPEHCRRRRDLSAVAHLLAQREHEVAREAVGVVQVTELRLAEWAPA